MKIISEATRWVIFGIVASIGLTGQLFAENIPKGSKAEHYMVKEFDDDEIEMKVVTDQGSQIKLVSSGELGALPLTVIDDDKKGFVLVRLNNSSQDEVWLSKSYLIFNNDEQPVCLHANIGQRTDRRLASAHGAGEKGCLLKP